MGKNRESSEEKTEKIEILPTFTENLKRKFEIRGACLNLKQKIFENLKNFNFFLKNLIKTGRTRKKWIGAIHPWSCSIWNCGFWNIFLHFRIKFRWKKSLYAIFNKKLHCFLAKKFCWNFFVSYFYVVFLLGKIFVNFFA